MLSEIDDCERAMRRRVRQACEVIRWSELAEAKQELGQPTGYRRRLSRSCTNGGLAPNIPGR